MNRIQLKKPAKVADSRASYVPPFLDEDPDIDLIQPDPEDSDVEAVISGKREFTAKPRMTYPHRRKY